MKLPIERGVPLPDKAAKLEPVDKWGCIPWDTLQVGDSVVWTGRGVSGLHIRARKHGMELVVKEIVTPPLVQGDGQYRIWRRA